MLTRVFTRKLRLWVVTSVRAIPTTSPVLNARPRFSLCRDKHESKPRWRASHLIIMSYDVLTQRCGSYLVLWGEGAVGDVWGEIRVIDSAEGQAVGPAAAEVSDVNILKDEKDEGEDYSPSIMLVWTGGLWKASFKRTILRWQRGIFCCTLLLNQTWSLNPNVLLKLNQRYLVALRPALTPAKQRVSLRASVATQQHVKTVLGPWETIGWGLVQKSLITNQWKCCYQL